MGMEAGDQEFGVGTVGMTCFCSMSETSAWKTQRPWVGRIWKCLMTQRQGLLPRVSSHGLSLWLGFLIAWQPQGRIYHVAAQGCKHEGSKE